MSNFPTLLSFPTTFLKIYHQFQPHCVGGRLSNDYHLSSIDFSKLKPIPSVKKVELDFEYSSHQLKEVFRVFPCVEEFHSWFNRHTFIKLIKQGKWPTCDMWLKIF